MSSSNKKVVKASPTTGTPNKKSFTERFHQFKASTPATNSGKQTTINICKIFDEDGNLIAFSINGFYGGRDYFMNTILSGQILLYLDRLNTFITAGRINALQDVRYVAIDATSPTVLVSALPKVENLSLKEDINQTYDSFIEYFTEFGDPVNNNCKIIFNYNEDFHLKTEDEVNGFFFLSSLINLPDRLKQVNNNNTSSPKK